MAHGKPYHLHPSQLTMESTKSPSSHSQLMANNSNSKTAYQPPLVLPGKTKLAIMCAWCCAGNAALNGLMLSSGASNPNTITPQSGNSQENLCSDQGLQTSSSPGHSKAPLSLRQAEAHLISHNRSRRAQLVENVRSWWTHCTSTCPSHSAEPPWTAHNHGAPESAVWQ